MTDVIRYSVKCGQEELATFTRRLDAVAFAIEHSRAENSICHVVDNGGKFQPLAYMRGFYAVDDDV
jgi:regulatory protein YycH of two-component signal transduction system YycFG